MKKLFCVGLGTLLGVVSSFAQTNLVANGEFEKTIEPWYGQKLEVIDGLEKAVRAPELLAYETTDTADKSAGALKVTIKKEPQNSYRSHNSGAICKLTSIIPAEKDVKVMFYAKSRSGAQILSVHRIWGGGGGTVLIDEKWEKHEFTLRLAHATDALVFSLVSQSVAGVQELTDGEFLLDHVSVTD